MITFTQAACSLLKVLRRPVNHEAFVDQCLWREKKRRLRFIGSALHRKPDQNQQHLVQKNKLHRESAFAEQMDEVYTAFWCGSRNNATRCWRIPTAASASSTIPGPLWIIIVIIGCNCGKGQKKKTNFNITVTQC